LKLKSVAEFEHSSCAIRTLNREVTEKIMDMTTIDPVRDELIKRNPNFRDLVQQHQNYERRLLELAQLTYPNDEEQLEETTLKKKKLNVKDEIYAIMQNYSHSH
jgi:uncharacterized protein YdcH (DUF465 family)